jgi:hypothetical protein
MGSFFSTLLLGLVAALITAVLQQRTWRHRSLVELAEKERAEARNAIEGLSEALDRRLEAQRTYTYAVLEGSITQEGVDGFRAATAQWMGGYSTNKSKLYHSFGLDAVIRFEEEVQRPVQRASAIVSLGRRLSPANLSSRDRELFFSSEHRLNIVQYEVYKFLRDLNDCVQNGEIGRTKAFNNLNENDPSMISHLYLIRRLLGIEGNIRQQYR